MLIAVWKARKNSGRGRFSVDWRGSLMSDGLMGFSEAIEAVFPKTTVGGLGAGS